MTWAEFEIHAGEKVDRECDYDAANIVYMYHPLVDTKEDIGKLWRLGGRILIDDMLPRARAIQKAEGEVRAVSAALDEAKDRLAKLRI
jgi:hypothetical protein